MIDTGTSQIIIGIILRRKLFSHSTSNYTWRKIHGVSFSRFSVLSEVLGSWPTTGSAKISPLPNYSQRQVYTFNRKCSVTSTLTNPDTKSVKFKIWRDTLVKPHKPYNKTSEFADDSSEVAKYHPKAEFAEYKYHNGNGLNTGSVTFRWHETLTNKR